MPPNTEDEKISRQVMDRLLDKPNLDDIEDTLEKIGTALGRQAAKEFGIPQPMAQVLAACTGVLAAHYLIDKVMK